MPSLFFNYHTVEPIPHCIICGTGSVMNFVKANKSMNLTGPTIGTPSYVSFGVNDFIPTSPKDEFPKYVCWVCASGIHEVVKNRLASIGRTEP